MTDPQPHTPTTAEIRNAVTQDESDWREAGAQFDRWLAARDARIRAAAEQLGKEAGWDEGYQDGYNDGLSDGHPLGNMRDPNENPYRGDKMKGNNETH